MSELCHKNGDLVNNLDAPNNNVVPVQQTNAHASSNTNRGEDVAPKRRKTRRGKSKRKHPYIKNKIKNKIIKQPEAPHNNNQFLLEDHGLIEDLDLKNASRTRDSSFSVDSDGEFYSSPDDEEFLIKDFVDQYESVQAERLLSMSKVQLIEEYQMLENRVELLTKRLRKTDEEEELEPKPELKREIERLKVENERLRMENEALRSKIDNCSDSEDSETDSSDSCSSSTSSSKSASPFPEVDYTQTNGHTSPQTV